MDRRAENWVLLLTGALVIVATLIDLAWTAIAVAAGAGPISRAVTRTAWRVLTVGNSSGGRREVAGYITVVLPLAWAVLLLAGFSLLYFGGDRPIVDSYGPGEVNNLTALTGLAFSTVAITFNLRVVTADAKARSAAWTIAGLGSDPYEVVSNALSESTGDRPQVVPEQEFQHGLTRLADRRRALTAVLDCGSWSWADICPRDSEGQ